MSLLVYDNGPIDTFFSNLTDKSTNKGPGGEHLAGGLAFGKGRSICICVDVIILLVPQLQSSHRPKYRISSAFSPKIATLLLPQQ